MEFEGALLGEGVEGEAGFPEGDLEFDGVLFAGLD